MPHISKQQVSNTVFEEILKEFFLILATPRKTKPLGELLTKTERIMLAKRLAIIAMLLEKQSINAVARRLKVSPQTPSRIQQRMQKGQYRALVVLVREHLDTRTFWGIIEKILSPGLVSQRGFRKRVDEAF